MASATAATAALSIVLIDVSDIRPNPKNPRRITDEHPSLAGLAESLLSPTGMIEPMVVRPTTTGYEILAGERRWRAARVAKLALVPCIVRDVDDDLAFSITVVENLQREDLHWLEEARGVAAMLGKGWDADAIAKQIGKSPAWVHLRAKLSTISQKWQKAVEDPKSVLHGWPVAMLELVGRLPLSTQEEILKEDSWDLQELTTVADLRDHINRCYLLLLKAAPWDLDDDKLLPKAGACSACPKRTSCQQHLFAEVKADTCLDAVCFKAKHTAFAAEKVDELREKHPDALVVTDDYSGSKGVIGRSAYDLAKASDKGAKQAVLISDDKQPKLVYVRTGKSRTGRDTAKSSSSPSSSNGTKKETPPKVRLAEFIRRRHRAQVNAVIAQLGGNPELSPYAIRRTKLKASKVGMPSTGDVISFAIVLGCDIHDYGERWPDVARMISGTVVQRETGLWDVVRPKVVHLLAWDAEHCEVGGAKLVAKACDIDWKVIVAEAQDKLPLPKSLAMHFAEDGTPLGKALATKAAAVKKAKGK